MKKIIIASIILAFVVGCLAFSNLLFYPKLILSEYKNLKKSDYISFEKKLGPLDESQWYIDSNYIGNVNGYDYYFELIHDMKKNEFISQKIIKKKKNNIIGMFDLKSLNCDKGEPFINFPCCVLKKGYLYFTAKGSKAIYYIDYDLKDCRCFIPEKFGTISEYYLGLYNDDIMYITNRFYVVNFDGKQETEICQISQIREILSETDSLNFKGGYESFDTGNCIICSEGKTIYFAVGNKLYMYNKDDFKEMNIKDLTKTKYTEYSHISEVKLYQNSDDVLVISFSCDDIHLCKGLTTKFLFSPKSGRFIKFTQRYSDRCRELKKGDNHEYIELTKQ